MKNYLFLLLIFCFGCATKQNSLVSPKFQSQLLSNEKMSCRALLVDEDYIWLGMDKGRFGYYDKKKDTLLLKTIGFVSNSTEFRSIAMTKEAVFILTVGNPALLLKIDKKTKKVRYFNLFIVPFFCFCDKNSNKTKKVLISLHNIIKTVYLR